MVGSRGLDPLFTQVLRQGLGSASERTRVNDEHLRRGLVEGLVDRLEAEPVSDSDSRGVFSGDADNRAHACSNCCAMAVTTSSTGPGPDSTTMVATDW